MRGLRLLVYADGASRGNPGPAAAGAVLTDERGNRLGELSRYLGTATNNQAEYHALIGALEMAARLRPESVRVYLDSELVVKQVNGQYRMKNPGLRPLLDKALSLLERFAAAEVTHIPGYQNGEAHRLAVAALKGAKGVTRT